MNDIERRLTNMSAAKRELLGMMLRAKQRIGRGVTAMAWSALSMSPGALRAEAVLEPAIDPSRARPPRGGGPGAILLTGATGFLGAFLLNELLGRTSARIYCLVRAASEDEARRRVSANLSGYVLSPPTAERIVPVIGDLAAPLLGLDAKTFACLADEIDHIHHCGAVVKWTYPYATLKPTNVHGTAEVLRLACSDRLKPVHFMSTVGVFSSSEYDQDVVFETEALENSGPISVGYAQTKWVAEKLVWLAGERGLPISVYRPNTAPASRTGAFNRNDHISQIIRGCIELGAAPDLPTTMSGAAVDFVAAAVTHLSLRPTSAAKAFHLVNPVEVRWIDIVEWIRRYGYEVEIIPYEDWTSRVAASVFRSEASGFASLSPFFTEALFDKVRLPRFDTTNVRAGLVDGIQCPEPLYERFRLSLDYFTRTGFMPPPRARRPPGPRLAARRPIGGVH